MGARKDHPFKGAPGFFPIQITVSAPCAPVLYSLPYREAAPQNPALAPATAEAQPPSTPKSKLDLRIERLIQRERAHAAEVLKPFGAKNSGDRKH